MRQFNPSMKLARNKYTNSLMFRDANNGGTIVGKFTYDEYLTVKTQIIAQSEYYNIDMVTLLKQQIYLKEEP